MSIHLEYVRYLKHFGKTCSIYQFYRNTNERNLIGLRHDVDYSLDLALEMAWLEHDYGFQSSYYVLHTHDYVDDPQFFEKCSQIQRLGHEIGFHNNLITHWLHTGQPVEAHLAYWLQKFAAHGIQIKGTATHGDRLCYQHSYSNSWVFRASRVEALNSDRPLNAEGVLASSPDEALVAPLEGYVSVQQQVLPLWHIDMGSYGLEYEAHRVPYDYYFSDSGGGWTRTPDPLASKLPNGRIQVLMHPIWWKTEQRIYFFMSTARSGSKWLTNLLDKGSSVTSRHEFSLNHDYDHQNGLVKNKRTSENFAIWSQDKELVREYLKHVRDWTQTLYTNYVEANVYLAHLIPEVLEVFPNAIIIHLHRDGRRVVRSLLNRSWYDTPEDTDHPRFAMNEWDFMSQLSRAAWYYRLTNEVISPHAMRRLSFEQLSSDFETAQTLLNQIGLKLTLPEAAQEAHQKIVNPNISYAVPEFSEWNVDKKSEFYDICKTTLIDLGYLADEKPPYIQESLQRPPKVRKFRQKTLFNGPTRNNIITRLLFKEYPYSAVGCEIVTSPSSLGISLREDRQRHSYVTFGKKTWGHLDRHTAFKFSSADFSDNVYFRLEVEATLSHTLKGSLRTFMFNEAGENLPCPHLCVLRAGHVSNNASIAFSPVPKARWFSFGFYFSQSEGYGECIVKSLTLVRFSTS